MTTRQLIKAALAEDVGPGDVTSRLTVPAGQPARARLVARTSGILAGIDVCRQVFSSVDPTIRFAPQLRDGARFRKDQVLAAARGRARSLLTAERTALNFIQRLSGIATATRRFVDAVRGTRAVILDTRKTIPGWRALEKYAVRCGGGTNHRAGLCDMILIKDNHIAAAGSITEAVARVRAGDAHRRPIEVEVTTLAELAEAVALGVDRVMLDNMGCEEMREAVRITAGRVPLEASGGVRLDTVAAIAATGVDLISAGAITHSISALDISLDLDPATVRGQTSRG